MHGGPIQIVPAGNPAAALAKNDLLGAIGHADLIAIFADKPGHQLKGGEGDALSRNGSLLSVDDHHHRAQGALCHTACNQGEVDRLLYALGHQGGTAALGCEGDGIIPSTERLALILGGHMNHQRQVTLNR